MPREIFKVWLEGEGEGSAVELEATDAFLAAEQFMEDRDPFDQYGNNTSWSVQVRTPSGEEQRFVVEAQVDVTYEARRVQPRSLLDGV